MERPSCYVCGKVSDEVEGRKVPLGLCSKCGNYFCSSHLFAGNHQYKRLCAECLKKVAIEEAGLKQQKDSERYQREANFFEEDKSDANSSMPYPNLTKWEYQSLFIPFNKNLEIIKFMDKPDLDTIVLPKPKKLNMDLSMINKLGEQGWEIVSTFPVENEYFLRDAKHSRDFTTAKVQSGMAVIVKRRKL